MRCYGLFVYNNSSTSVVYNIYFTLVLIMLMHHCRPFLCKDLFLTPSLISNTLLSLPLSIHFPIVPSSSPSSQIPSISYLSVRLYTKKYFSGLSIILATTIEGISWKLLWAIRSILKKFSWVMEKYFCGALQHTPHIWWCNFSVSDKKTYNFFIYFINVVFIVSLLLK